MKTILAVYLAVLACFLLLDFVWLGLIASDFYAAALGPLLKQPIDVLPAAIFYAAYAAGIVYFAVRPGTGRLPARTAAFRGALLGLLAYGAYDLTNLATLKGWPLFMSIVDMAWGAVVTGLSAAAGALAAGFRNGPPGRSG
jgi:uncharacterized membrane protein